VARVLVVDDEPDLRELLRISLSLAGHDVSLASDGRRGLEGARQQRPDVVVLDVMMPAMDGWTVLTMLKSDPDPAVAMIPVVMLTARADDLDVIKGGIEGAVRYLTKPFALDDLHRVVADAVAGQPEPEQRRAAQHAALVHLAQLERGTAPAGAPGAKPRMSRLEPVSGGRVVTEAASPRPDRPNWPSWLSVEALTERDREILEVVLSSPSLGEARARLQVSRSYLYARLRHMASSLDFESGPALVQALRAANARREREPRSSWPAVPTGR
jgi:two-component system phosphate regulon response regulator PhoB